ncbi:hypothetical protein SHKM778_72570 [Streptomyces sp. KM77-8]|uniref:Peptidoglycan recognition protein family domain-containing protein n=1 Tax=Streptomyces haneummycinicus TaxID=3074435 RepID=A0AAT9HTG4_9ACTN
MARRRRPRTAAPRYDDEVVAVFIHHTDSPNGYDCADAPGIIRTLYEGQTGARDWDDLGYNFVVDRCGTVYEGRAGGTDRPVTGAHTQGFNHRSTGIAALGTFTEGVDVPRRCCAPSPPWPPGSSARPTPTRAPTPGWSPATTAAATRPAPPPRCPSSPATATPT